MPEGQCLCLATPSRHPMNLDERLASAFAAWSEARNELGKLRAQTASAPAGKQLAPSPEAVALFDSIKGQEAACMRLWLELAKVAEERATLLEADRDVEAWKRVTSEPTPTDKSSPANSGPAIASPPPEDPSP